MIFHPNLQFIIHSLTYYAYVFEFLNKLNLFLPKTFYLIYYALGYSGDNYIYYDVKISINNAGN